MKPYAAQEIARRGKELYERRIRASVEPEHEGRFLVGDVESDGYALVDDEPEAFDRAREEYPEGVLYLLRAATGRLTASASGLTGRREALARARRLQWP